MDLGGALESIIINAENAQTGAVYLDESDTLLHCTNCHEPRQMVIDMLGKKRKVPVICSCIKKQLEEEEKQRCIDEWRKKVKEMRSKGITDQSYLDSTFEADTDRESKISKIAREYSRDFRSMKDQNVGLLFWGNVGTGKSFYASCIANEIIDGGRSVLMTDLTKLIDSISKNYGERRAEVLQQIESVDLLVLDDLGVERRSDFAYNNVFEIIDTRARSKKPMIVTTNISLSDLKNPKDERYLRIYERILESCIPVGFQGESKRKEISKSKAEKFKAKFGL